jgi:4-hydroxybutyrate dehydrogenase/sulfolactaldehyde 3-reductase
MSERDCVAVLGLGAMGLPISRCLLRGGHAVFGVDLAEERRELLREAGGSPVARAAELPEECSVFLVVLPDPATTEDGLFGPSGLAAGSRGLRPGDRVVNLGTIGPTAVLALGERLAAAGATLVDAPMGKSSQAAETGDLALMVSGEDADMESVRPVLSLIAGEIMMCGPLGDASTVKMVNNLISACVLTAVSEGLMLGAKAGVSLELMVKVLSATGADTWHLRHTFGERVRDRDFAPGFMVDLALKDLRLALGLAAEQSLELPISEQTLRRYAEASEAGLGREDWGSMVKLIERDAGMEL